MQVNFLNEVDESFNQFESFLPLILNKTLDLNNKDKNVSVNIVHIDDEAMKQYNQDFRQIDRTTDVLSFVDGEVMDDILHLGDILVSYEAVNRQAEEYGHSVKREFCFLVTHGYLHLLGYDHMEPEEEKEMFDMQKEILSGIVEKNS